MDEFITRKTHGKRFLKHVKQLKEKCQKFTFRVVMERISVRFGLVVLGISYNSDDIV